MRKRLPIFALIGMLFGCSRSPTSFTQPSDSTEPATQLSAAAAVVSPTFAKSTGRHEQSKVFAPTVKSYTVFQNAGGSNGQALIIPSISNNDHVLLHYETHEAGITFTSPVGYTLLDASSSTAPSYADWHASGLSGKNVRTFVAASAFSHGGISAAVIACSTGIDVHVFGPGKSTPLVTPAEDSELPIALYDVDATLPKPANTGTILGWNGYDLNSIAAYSEPKISGSTPVGYTNAADYGSASDYASGLVLFKPRSGLSTSDGCSVRR